MQMDLAKYRVEGFSNHFFCDLWAVGFWRTDHADHHDGRGLDDCFEGIRGIAPISRRQRRDDRRFLEALQYFVVHNITWRALPEKFGHWNSVWKRFWRLSRSGTFEAFFDALAALSETAHLVQMFDSTVVRGGLGCLNNFSGSISG
jgi:transposase